MIALLVGLIGLPEAVAKQTLRFEVAVPSDALFSGFSVAVTRLGERTELALTDAPPTQTQGHDWIPYDGVFIGEDSAEWSRYVVVELSGRPVDGDEEVLYVGIVRTEDTRHNVLGWQVLHAGEGFTARRVANAYPGNAPQIVGGLGFLMAYGWGVFALVYVIWLTGQAGRAPR